MVRVSYAKWPGGHCFLHFLQSVTLYFICTSFFLQQTEPKGAEVRAKIVAVVKWDESGAGFDVHFRNGNTWHLMAENAVSSLDV